MEAFVAKLPLEIRYEILAWLPLSTVCHIFTYKDQYFWRLFCEKRGYIKRDDDWQIIAYLESIRQISAYVESSFIRDRKP